MSQTLGWSITFPVATPTQIKPKKNKTKKKPKKKPKLILQRGKSNYCKYLQACQHQPYGSKNYFTLTDEYDSFKNKLVHFFNYTRSLDAHTQWK